MAKGVLTLNLKPCIIVAANESEECREREASNRCDEAGGNGRNAMRHCGARPPEDGESVLGNVDTKEVHTTLEQFLRLDHVIEPSKSRTLHAVVDNPRTHGAPRPCHVVKCMPWPIFRILQNAGLNLSRPEGLTKR